MMSKQEDKWIHSFRKQMEGHTERAPEHLWEELERELAVPRTVPFHRRYRWAAAVAAVLLVSSATLWWVAQEPSGPMEQVAGQFAGLEPHRPGIQEPAGVPVQAATVPPTGGRVLAQASARAQAAPALWQEPVPAAVADALPAAEEAPRTEAGGAAPAPRTADTSPQAKEAPKAATRAARQAMRPAGASREWWRQAKRRPEPQYNKVEVGLSVGNAPVSAGNAARGYRDLSPRARETFQIGLLPNTGILPPEDLAVDAGNYAYAQVLSRNVNDDVRSDATHKMPVTVAATVRWNLTDRWAVETGLMYTLLSSELWSGTEANHYESDQKLHYVGIPLKASYRLWENKRFAFYASAGGAVEKSVSGKLTTHYTLTDDRPMTETTDLDVDELQWSVSAAIGAQLKLSKHIGLYIEPGLNYYFKDGSGVETIRKEHPFNFNLQGGLRFSF